MRKEPSESQRSTPLLERSTVLGSALIAASLLVGVAGLFHPVLSGDGAAQLADIAGTRGWRAIHWSISFGYVLAVAGLGGLSNVLVSTPGASAARIGATLAAFGYAVSLVGVLFMLGAAHSIASTYRASAPGPAAANAVHLYETLHPFALAALRIGAFAVSLGVLALAWSVKTARVLRSWLGWIGLGAGLVGAGVALGFSEHSPAIVTGIGLAAIWQLLVGALLVTRGRLSG